jgi:hypothetical protein
LKKCSIRSQIQVTKNDVDPDPQHRRQACWVACLCVSGTMSTLNFREEIRKRQARQTYEDPLADIKTDRGAASFREMLTRGAERSRETYSEIRQAQPFSYYAQSFKHGIWVTREAKVGSFWVVFIFCLVGVLTVLDLRHELPDSYAAVEKLPRTKNAESYH